jgi:homoserine/homoserine lactone efflux protein
VLNLNLYMSFCFLMAMISFTPGPNVLLMVRYGLEYKLSKAVFPIPGIALALFTYALVVAIGMARLLIKYPQLYDLIRLLGSFYLIYLGLSGFYKLYLNKTKNCSAKVDEKNPKRRRLFFSGYLCALTNPKILIIYMVILPQFVDKTHKAFPQFCILSLTHIFLVVISMLTYCVLANKSQNFIKKYSKIQVSCTNFILLGLGVFMLLEKF